MPSQPVYYLFSLENKKNLPIYKKEKKKISFVILVELIARPVQVPKFSWSTSWSDGTYFSLSDTRGKQAQLSINIVCICHPALKHVSNMSPFHRRPPADNLPSAPIIFNSRQERSWTLGHLTALFRIQCSGGSFAGVFLFPPGSIKWNFAKCT
jgi:hypothetical protein